MTSGEVENPYDDLETGDPCPNCGTALTAIVFALHCPECGWDNV